MLLDKHAGRRLSQTQPLSAVTSAFPTCTPVLIWAGSRVSLAATRAEGEVGTIDRKVTQAGS